jgi:hypothetical protein
MIWGSVKLSFNRRNNFQLVKPIWKTVLNRVRDLEVRAMIGIAVIACAHERSCQET